MSPFSFKEGESWITLGKYPVDIRIEGNQKGLVQVFPQQDPEQVRVAVEGRLIVKVPSIGDVIFPGEKDSEGNMPLINRRSFTIEDPATNVYKSVGYRKKPIGKR